MATNFFDQQDAARRQTGRLVFYFVLAVVAIILAVHLAVTAAFLAAEDRGGDLSRALGAHGYVTKGDADQLLDAIPCVLDGKTYLPSARV